MKVEELESTLSMSGRGITVCHRGMVLEAQGRLAEIHRCLRGAGPDPWFMSVGFFETHRDFSAPTSVRDTLYSQPPENLPDEIEHAVAHETDFHQFMLYTPVPGTPLYHDVAQQGRLIDVNLADIHGQYKFNFQHSAISRDQSSHAHGPQ